jgi:hypothetical protein
LRHAPTLKQTEKNPDAPKVAASAWLLCKCASTPFNIRSCPFACSVAENENAVVRTPRRIILSLARTFAKRRNIKSLCSYLLARATSNRSVLVCLHARVSLLAIAFQLLDLLDCTERRLAQQAQGGGGKQDFKQWSIDKKALSAEAAKVHDDAAAAEKARFVGIATVRTRKLTSSSNTCVSAR